MSTLTMLGLAVMGAVLYTLFQKSAPAFGLFISMGTVVLVLWKISAAAQTVLSGLTKLEQRAGGDAFSCLLRCTGVILLHEGVGGYVLEAVISFTAAVVLTALYIKFRKRKQIP